MSIAAHTPLRYAQIPERFNVATHFLDRNLEEGRADGVALTCDRPDAEPTRTSYGELAARTNRIGNGLLALGVRAEERVLLALADGPDFVASWFATLKAGAVVAEAYTFLQAKDYLYYVNYMRAGVVIVDASTLPKLREIRPQCPSLRTVVVAGSAPDLHNGEVSLDEIAGAASDQLDAAPTSRDDIALWKFTTGSTGAPKAAVHCHHDPLISFDHYAQGVLGLQADDTVLPVPKLFFGYARDITALFNFGVGGSGLIFPDRSTPARMFELIERHRPTILVQVPTMMRAMLEERDAHTHDLSSLRLVVSSGEALPRELHERWLDTFGTQVLEGIGSSELYHIYVSNRPGQVRTGSTGMVVPGYAAQLLDTSGQEVAPGEPGELWIEGESAALLYWNDHEKSKQTFAGDRVRTGDLFMQDADGYLVYRGRADDLLKVGGIWVAPLEIETCMREHPGVSDCAVVGVEVDGLVSPTAFIVTTGTDTDLDASAVIAFVRERLAPHKAPREVTFVVELPKTASGKVDKQALRSRHETEGA
jgi:benzoate-CoA ligase family protein